MRRILVWASALCLCAPALAADWSTKTIHAAAIDGPRCVRVETLRPTCPDWIFNPDPYNIHTPQYLPVYSWVCDRVDHPRVWRRPPRPRA
jgi:hypothetical protein